MGLAVAVVSRQDSVHWSETGHQLQSIIEAWWEGNMVVGTVCAHMGESHMG